MLRFGDDGFSGRFRKCSEEKKKRRRRISSVIPLCAKARRGAQFIAARRYTSATYAVMRCPSVCQVREFCKKNE